MPTQVVTEEETKRIKELINQHIKNRSLELSQVVYKLKPETPKGTFYRFMDKNYEGLLSQKLAERLIRYLLQFEVVKSFSEGDKLFLNDVAVKYSFVEIKESHKQKVFDEFIISASGVEQMAFLMCEKTDDDDLGALGVDITKMGQKYIHAMNKLLSIGLIEKKNIMGEIRYIQSEGYELHFPKIEIWRCLLAEMMSHIQPIDPDKEIRKRKASMYNLNDKGVEEFINLWKKFVEDAREIKQDKSNHGTKTYFLAFAFDLIEDSEDLI